MRGFWNWLGDVVSPVVEAVQQVKDTIEEAIVEPLIEASQEFAEAVTEFTSNGITAAAETVVDWLAPLLEPAGEEAIEAVIDGLDAKFANDYQPVDSDFSRFDPVVPEAEQVAHQTIDSNDMTIAEQVEVRDAVVAATFGYADYSVLLEGGSIDEDGYILDAELFYSEAGLYEDWMPGMQEWADERFEVIRVQEAIDGGFIDGYQANVTLTQSTVTGEYFVCIGGTDSFDDLWSDLSLILGEDTGDSQDAVSDIIGGFYADDIPDGAVVNLAGQSLGAAEALLQYQDNPDAYDDVYAIQAVGLGGFDGTYYDQYVWDGMGDPNIIEINADDADTDINDLITSWGHIGAGTTYQVDDLVTASESATFAHDLELVDAHLLDNLWASLPEGELPEIPSDDLNEVLMASAETDVFDLA